MGFFLAELSSIEETGAGGLPTRARTHPPGAGDLVTAPLAVCEPMRAAMATDPSGLFWCATGVDGAGAVLMREDGGL